MKKQKNTLTALADIPVPDSAAIEWQVLSDVLADNGTMTAVAGVVDEDHFTSDLRKKVWNECLRRFNEGLPFDVPNVAISVGPEFVQHVYSSDGSVDEYGYRFAEEHARALHTAIMRRRCYQAALEILDLSQTPGTTDASIYSGAAEAVARLEPTTVRREIRLVDVLNGIAEEVEERARDERDGRPGRVTTGMRALDDVLYGGMAPGQLVILAARPSVGKTALMLHMARKAAEKGSRAAMFSIEMTADELGTRMLASVTEEYEDENYPGLDRPRRSVVTPYMIARGFDSPEAWSRFEKAVSEIDGLPVLINENARDLRDIVSRLTVLVRQGRCDVAYIDYLGLVKNNAADPRTPLYQVIADITGTLKAAAKNLRIPIVLLCQLNRDAAKEDNGKKSPELYNLRDSGAIEQDADVVLMLKQSPGPRLPDLEVWVKKNRNGEKDFAVRMRPSDNYMAFSEIDVIPN